MDDEGPSRDKIRVLVVDDHPAVLSGLQNMLSLFEDIQVVGLAEDGATAVAMCRRLRPDVVLMDLVMPVMDGREATELILERDPDTRILALTSYTDVELIQSALRAGAMGFLTKSATSDEIASGIRAAHAGKSTLAPEASEALLLALRKEEGGHLTKRERQVLRLMAKGLSNNEIAQMLDTSLSTVKTHVSSIITKLGASSRTEAAIMAVRLHII
jgi:two-component system, NarL family, response regulator LiaR